jgi:hypothetical protein
MTRGALRGVTAQSVLPLARRAGPSAEVRDLLLELEEPLRSDSGGGGQPGT